MVLRCCRGRSGRPNRAANDVSTGAPATHTRGSNEALSCAFAATGGRPCRRRVRVGRWALRGWLGLIGEEVGEVVCCSDRGLGLVPVDEECHAGAVVTELVGDGFDGDAGLGHE